MKELKAREAHKNMAVEAWRYSNGMYAVKAFIDGRLTGAKYFNYVYDASECFDFLVYDCMLARA